MESNPFDDRDATFSVLTNDDGMYSLWPSFADTPEGWTSVLTDQPRNNCDDYITEHWTSSGPDLAPGSEDDD